MDVRRTHHDRVYTNTLYELGNANDTHTNNKLATVSPLTYLCDMHVDGP
jgi:hypothetical protein